MVAHADLGYEVLVPAKGNDQEQACDERGVDERQGREDDIVLAGAEDGQEERHELLAELDEHGHDRNHQAEEERRKQPAAPEHDGFKEGLGFFHRHLNGKENYRLDERLAGLYQRAGINPPQALEVQRLPFGPYLLDEHPDLLGP